MKEETPPRSSMVKKGMPVELDINDEFQLTGCLTTWIIPKHNVTISLLQTGQKSVTFTPTEEGTVPIVCSMGGLMTQLQVTS